MPAHGAAPALKTALKALLGVAGCIHRAAAYIRRNPHAAHLAADAAHKGWRVRSIGRGQVGNLRGNNVVEDAEPGMHHCPAS